MRRFLSGGVLLSLGLLAGHAAVEAWMEARAVFALEEARRRLPEGGHLSWQRLDAQPLRLAVAVEGVRLDLPPGGPVRRLEAGTVRLAQAAGGIDTLGRAASVRASDLTIGLAEDAGTVRIGTIEGARVDIDALTAALARPQPWDAIGELSLGPLVLENLEVATPDRRSRVPRLSIGGWAERRLDGLSLEGFEAEDAAGGTFRLATLALDRLDLEAADAQTLASLGEDPLAIAGFLDRLRIDGLRLSGAELADAQGRLELARLELARLGQGRLEGLRIEDTAFDGPEGRGGLGLFEFRLVDWSRVRLDRLVRAGGVLGELAAQAGAEDEAADEADEEQERNGTDASAGDGDTAGEDEATLAGSFAGLELAAELARFEVGPLRIERASAFDAAGAGAALARLRWDGIADRRFGAIELEGLLGKTEDGAELRLERFEQSAVTIAPPDFAERLDAAPRTQEALQELTAELARLPWDSRTLLAGIALDRDGRTGFGIRRLELRLDQQASKKRTSLELADLVLDPAAMQEESLEETFAMAGIERLQLALRLVSSFDEATLEAVLDPFELDAPGLLALRTSFQAKLGADPTADPVTASTDAVLLRAELRLQDKGLIDRQLAQMAKDAGKKRADLAKELVRDLRSEDPFRSLLDQKRAAELEKFLTKPRVLVVRFAPPKPVTFMAGFMGVLATPGQAAKTLGLTIEARDS
ncbi:MAG: hypothetical protein NZ555_01525 [Geminicoccaceae bacterium]|nr:hypothetical protein [Geminicoccaceae bacterium]MDW8370206.1 hypothetical protein [Geminicoccaceae bacterium]